MTQEKSSSSQKEKQFTQWEGLFVSQHVWEDDDAASDPHPMLSAEEKQAIMDMLVVAYERKCPVFIQSWQERHFHFHHCTIQEMDYTKRTVTYEDRRGISQLSIDAITSMHMLDKE